MTEAVSSIDFEMFWSRHIASLPQVDHIERTDAENWLETVLATEEDLSFHLARLPGIGGSEVIAAAMLDKVARDNGVVSTFTTPAQVVREKLMIAPPEPPDSRMLMGRLIEPVVRELFLKETGAKRREDLMALAKEVTPNRPWIVGNPDDIVEIGGKIYIVDYKVPKEGASSPSIVYPDYICQLHWYDYKLALTDGKNRLAGFADGLILAPLDFGTGKIYPYEIDYSRNLTLLLDACAERLWHDFVLKGQIPEPKLWISKPKKPDTTLPDEAKQQLRTLEQRLLASQAMADQLTTKIKATQKDIEAILRKHGSLSAWNPEAIKLVVKRTLIEDKALELLRRHQIPLSEVGKPTGFDTEKMAKRLAELGEDVEAYRTYRPDRDKVAARLKALGIEAPIVEKPTFQTKAAIKALGEKMGDVPETLIETGTEKLVEAITEKKQSTQSTSENQEDNQSLAPTA